MDDEGREGEGERERERRAQMVMNIDGVAVQRIIRFALLSFAMQTAHMEIDIERFIF